MLLVWRKLPDGNTVVHPTRMALLLNAGRCPEDAWNRSITVCNKPEIFDPLVEALTRAEVAAWSN